MHQSRNRAATLVVLVLSATAGVAGAAVDEFLCYKSKFKREIQVGLSDVFDAGAYEAKIVKLSCTPATSAGSPLLDPDTHLAGYKLKGPHARQSGIEVTNQLGTFTFDTKKTDFFFTPATATVPPDAPPMAPGFGTHGVDRFRCVKISTTKGTPKFPKGIVLTGSDRFGTHNLEIKRPSALCVSTDQNGEGVKDTDAALACYKAKAKPSTKIDTVQMTDQFAAHTGAFSTESQFCIPSSVGDAPVTTTTLPSTGACDTFLAEWGGSGAAAGEFDLPLGLATSSAGDLYVADLLNSRIQQFDEDGIFIRQWGSFGSAPGEFNQPIWVDVDAAGSVYVMDRGNNRLQKFAANGNFLLQWGGTGSGPGQFSSATAIATGPGGAVYVADTGNNRVQKFGSTGSFVLSWGGPGTGNGEFSSPLGVAADAAGNVYVTEIGGHRVQKFDAAGTFLTKWGTFGSGAGEFSTPAGVTVDGAGDVYVVDRGNDRIQKFDSNGGFIAEWGSFGSNPGQFDLAGDIAASGLEVFVSDSNNDRIQRFACQLD